MYTCRLWRGCWGSSRDLQGYSWYLWTHDQGKRRMISIHLWHNHPTGVEEVDGRGQSDPLPGWWVRQRSQQGLQCPVCPSPPWPTTRRAQVSFLRICQVVLLLLFSTHVFRLDRSKPVYDMLPDPRYAPPATQQLPFSEVRNLWVLDYIIDFTHMHIICKNQL